MFVCLSQMIKRFRFWTAWWIRNPSHPEPPGWLGTGR